MVAYIKQIAQDLVHDPPRGRPRIILEALSEELGRLDPRDFLPAAQANFVRVKMSIKDLLASHPGEGVEFLVRARKLATSTLHVLDLYGGDGSAAELRSFAFVKSADVKALVERDYRELSLILFPSGAWKSTVVMAGSILEAILFDRLTADAGSIAKSLAAPRSPKKADLVKGEWKLYQLIEVAEDLGQLPRNRTAAIDTVLRDYRNFIHPVKELRSAHPCTEAEACMAKGALDAICNFLTPP